MIQSSEPFGKAILMAVWRMDWMEMGQGGCVLAAEDPIGGWGVVYTRSKGTLG